MYYAWSWWLLTWLVPMGLVLWLLFGWDWRARGYGRQKGYWGYGSYRHDDWDDRWSGRRWTDRYRNRGPLNYRRSDARIAEDVSDRLLLDEDIDASAMTVRVDNGRVILAGTVETRFEKRWAERIAESVAGVTDIDNQLRLGPVDHASRPTTNTSVSDPAAMSATSH